MLCKKVIYLRVLVDADACPVREEVEEVASKYLLPLIFLCDTNHNIDSDYAEVQIVSAGAESVDTALINLCRPGDIVVTQDYGVATMALAKGAYAIHQDGWQYKNDNIDHLLMGRYVRKEGLVPKGTGSKKREEEDDRIFTEKFEDLVLEALEAEDERAANEYP